MENLIFHLKKGYSVNCWEGGGGKFPLCPFSVYGSILFHPELRLIFQKKFHGERGVINCFECNVKHGLPNFEMPANGARKTQTLPMQRVKNFKTTQFWLLNHVVILFIWKLWEWYWQSSWTCLILHNIYFLFLHDRKDL